VTPLDNPIWTSLCGGHEKLALRSGRAARYPEAISPFAGLAEASSQAMADLAGLVPSEGLAAVIAADAPIEEGTWTEADRLPLIQMVCDEALSAADTATEPLSPDDVPEMLALTEQARPGPFFERTIEMGRYIGVREGGKILAMGGERLHPAGFTEVSAICTAESHRGRGLGEVIVRDLVSAIQDRGERPFLHVMEGSPTEGNAVRLYERLGFRERKRHTLVIVQRV
jgi:predicted GNAT family acetyltransferase